ncbi:MAG: hypothetical protein FWD12_03805, partial [Alphaproteobacteria bacterium]|nr:hypothetical protein [Alphaproteobacteria bacterium]
GEALISSLEVLSRARPHEPWAAAGLQNLWDSLADEDQILFLALTDDGGRPLAWAGREPPAPELFQGEPAGRPGPAPARGLGRTLRLQRAQHRAQAGMMLRAEPEGPHDLALAHAAGLLVDEPAERLARGQGGGRLRQDLPRRRSG